MELLDDKPPPLPQLLRSPRRNAPTPEPSGMIFEPPPLRRDASITSLHFPPAPPVATPSPSGLESLPTTVASAVAASPPCNYAHYGATQLSIESWANSHFPDARVCSRFGWRRGVLDVVQAVPSVAIVVLVNLMICVPFGLSFFPVE